jgi:hypothetical protein
MIVSKNNTFIQMKNILEHYPHTGSFLFSADQDLSKQCNAPKDKVGIYLFYDHAEMGDELLYIGCCGHLKCDGHVHVRITGGGGIKGRIVKGHQFRKMKRCHSLPLQMQKERISTLGVDWYVTCTSDLTHSPIYVESCLLQAYFEEFGRLPRWNKKF